MEQGKKFKTKTGYCHILPDRIVLTSDSFAGDLYEIKPKNKITLALAFYTVFIVYLLYKTYTLSDGGETTWALVHVCVAGFLAFAVIKSINNSSTPVIYRKDIKNVRLLPASKLTRACFEVLYTNDKGKTKKRLIMLPGSLSNGKSAAEEAVKVMKSEKLLR